MKKKTLITLLLALITAFALNANAFADDAISGNLTSGQPMQILATDTSDTAVAFVMYPELTIDAQGRIAGSGTPAAVTYTNYNEYIDYFYQYGNSWYQFANVTAETRGEPGSWAVTGGYAKLDTTQTFTFQGCVSDPQWNYPNHIQFYSNLKVTSGNITANGTGTTLSGSSAVGKYTIGSGYCMIRVLECTDAWLSEYNGAYFVNGTGNPVVVAQAFEYRDWSFRQVPICTIAFDAQGGTCSAASKKGVQGSMCGELPTPIRTGYTFAGWYTETNAAGTLVQSTSVCCSNMTLYAAWTINQYTVSFDSGGSGVVPVTQDYATEVAEPAAPTKTGHTFGGWFSDPELTAPVSWPYTIGAGDVTFYAAWTINQYTLNFDSNGGSEIAPVTQDYATTVAEPTAPTKTGHTFAAWFSDPELTTPVSWPYTIGAGNVTFYAAWTTNQYTASFDSGGGTDIAPVTQDYATTVAEPAAPTKSGHTFGGWFSDPELTAPVSWPYTIGAGDVTFHATWTINQYTVSFDSSGGSEVTPLTQDYATTVAEPTAPTKAGHTFGGWYSDPELTAPVSWPYTIGAGDVVFYVAWTANQYIVSFDSGGGSEVTPVTQDYATTVTEPTAPTKTGHTFDGWFSDPELTLPVSWPYTVGAGDVTFYAAWAINQHTVSFETNGGTDIAPMRQDYATTVVEPTVPTKAGHTFDGWFLDPELTALVGWPYTIGAGDVTLYAAWQINQYTVSFDSGSGTDVAPVTQDYATTVSEPTAPTKTGYTFGGWFSDPELTAPVSWPYTVRAGDMTLYAAWTANKYTVSFDSDGGTDVAPVIQDYATPVGEPTAPTKTGHTFAGWFSDPELTALVGWPYTIGAGDVTLYAKWTAMPSGGGGVIVSQPNYTVNFESNSGDVLFSQIVQSGNTVSAPPEPIKEGYVFDGWYLDSGCTIPWDFMSGTVTSSMTLYAKWSAANAKKIVTVLFDSNGGSNVADAIIELGTVLAEPAQPVREGFDFTGWFRDSSCSIPWSFSMEVAGGMTLYAGWTEADKKEEENPPSGEPDSDNIPPAASIGTFPNNPDKDDDEQPIELGFPDEPKHSEIEIVHNDVPVTDVGANSAPAENPSTDDKAGLERLVGVIACIVGALLALALILLMCINHRRKRVQFYDVAGNEISVGVIRKNRVDISKAVSSASGKLLRVCISDWYQDKFYGSDLEVCYNHETVGAARIEDTSFEINIG